MRALVIGRSLSSAILLKEHFPVNLIVNISEKGHRIVSAKRFEPGDHIHTLSGEYFDVRNKYTIEVNGRHLVDPVAKYLNHSFTPNMRIDGLNLIALCVIEAGEEITFDYTTTESEFSHPFIDWETGLSVGSTAISKEA
jgi:hypothetical protein